MNIPQEFDTIRPWEPEDLPEVFDRLLSNDQFKQVLAYLYPQVPFEMIAQKLKACKTNLDFQLAFALRFCSWHLKKAATGCEMDCTSLDNTRNYTFISNHRDIVLDSAIAFSMSFLSITVLRPPARLPSVIISFLFLGSRTWYVSTRRLS